MKLASDHAGERHFACKPTLAENPLGFLLMKAISVGIYVNDSDGLNALAEQHSGCRLDVALVQRDEYVADRGNTLRNRKAQPSGYQRRGGLPFHIVKALAFTAPQ